MIEAKPDVTESFWEGPKQEKVWREAALISLPLSASLLRVSAPGGEENQEPTVDREMEFIIGVYDKRIVFALSPGKTA